LVIGDFRVGDFGGRSVTAGFRLSSRQDLAMGSPTIP
jgi:hypothetical protein